MVLEQRPLQTSDEALVKLDSPAPRDTRHPHSKLHYFC